ncbi:hypothetical protein J6590_016098 [Homalodisca vitripennis]|nr:hypothetical protein J6590_016098 [Homalodisca vitripennis]
MTLSVPDRARRLKVTSTQAQQIGDILYLNTSDSWISCSCRSIVEAIKGTLSSNT